MNNYHNRFFRVFLNVLIFFMITASFEMFAQPSIECPDLEIITSELPDLSSGISYDKSVFTQIPLIKGFVSKIFSECSVEDSLNLLKNVKCQDCFSCNTDFCDIPKEIIFNPDNYIFTKLTYFSVPGEHILMANKTTAGYCQFVGEPKCEIRDKIPFKVLFSCLLIYREENGKTFHHLTAQPYQIINEISWEEYKINNTE